jgi:hypothetical protein
MTEIRESEVRGQMSEVRNQKAENQRSERSEDSYVTEIRESDFRVRTRTLSKKVSGGPSNMNFSIRGRIEISYLYRMIPYSFHTNLSL